jgi:hypothetical protein
MIRAVYEQVRAIVSGLGRAEWAVLLDHGERLQQLGASVPPAVWHKVSGSVATHYRPLEERYGRPTAIAILSAAIVGSAVPAPGTTFLAMASVIALAELHHQLGAGLVLGAADAVKMRLAESEILARQWPQDLAGVLKQESNDET